MDRRGGSSRGISLPADWPPRKDAPVRTEVAGSGGRRESRPRCGGRLPDPRDNVGPSVAGGRDSWGGGRGVAGIGSTPGRPHV